MSRPSELVHLDHIPEEHHTAYCQGYDDWFYGDNQNPYPINSEEYTYWLKGHTDGQDDDVGQFI